MTAPHFAGDGVPGGERRDESLVAHLAEELADRWRNGDRPLVEEYLDRHPDLWLQPTAALELIAEELALREEFGQPIVGAQLAKRFPQWRDQVRALGQYQQAFGAHAGEPEFPKAGATLGEFRLVVELGRGAHGGVFLARQSALAGRPVVLKLSPPSGAEHLSLARLQHTHIVPLHSAHEFPGHGLRGLCMPYFGGATLAAILAAVKDRPVHTRTGQHLVAALRAAQAAAPVPVAVAGPTCDALAHSTYTAALCQIGASLADALHFAHERGLLHLDLKPSNVLIAADGVPMLLDFHLARPPFAVGDAPLVSLGGTPGYMAPELAVAVDAVRHGSRIPVAVDARADVYSLGVLLREALAHAPDGQSPCVPTGLADVLARCTALEPADRYATACDVADDLRRHLADLPLKGVANRSLSERWGKWRRRRPFALPIATVALALIVVAVGLGLHADERAGRASAALRDATARVEERRYPEAVEAVRRGEALISGLSFRGELAAQLRDTRVRAERGQAAAELHQFCERVRPLYAVGVPAGPQLREAERLCRDLWAERDAIVRRLDGQQEHEAERQWRTDLLDLGILTADLRARTAPPGRSDAAHREALTILAEAEALLGPSGALYLERATHAEALGLAAEAGDATRRAEALEPHSAWEHLVAGRAYLNRGDTTRAAIELDRSLEREPGSLWANYYRGVCSLRAGEPAEAVTAFSSCVALSPRSGWCFYNRGLANTDSGRYDRACADFDRALALDSDLAPACLGRAVAHVKAQRFTEALADLQKARLCGLDAATVAYHTATVHLAAGDRPAAVASLRDCLAGDPTHREARELLDRLAPPH